MLYAEESIYTHKGREMQIRFVCGGSGWGEETVEKEWREGNTQIEGHVLQYTRTDLGLVLK